MTVSATRRNYEVVMGTPDGEWHQMLIPATNVMRACSKAIAAMQEKWGGIEVDEETGKKTAQLARTDIAFFSVQPEEKANGEINWPKIRPREGFEMPERLIDVHEFDIVDEDE
jgi:hypothetical protein